MTVQRNYNPPEPWLRPVQNIQPTLFPRPTDEWLAYARVSKDELKRWRELGWISFDVDEKPTFNAPELDELCFVRNIVRSGLSDEQINEMLGELPKPYSYDPIRTAYHFAWGWVRVPAIPDVDDIDLVIEENLSEWIRTEASLGNVGRLHNLAQEILNQIGTYGKSKRSSDEEIS